MLQKNTPLRFFSASELLNRLLVVITLLAFCYCGSEDSSGNSPGTGSNVDADVEITDLEVEEPEDEEITVLPAADNQIFVRQTDGSDSNTGLSSSPFLKIQTAIDYAKANYSSAAVYVAEGTYESDFNNTRNPVIMLANGISVYGGYSASDWELRDPDAHPTIIRDTSTAGGDTTELNTAIKGSGTISKSTIIDGLKVYGGDGDMNTAMFLEDGASLAVQNCYFYGGGSGTYTVGIYIFNGSSPDIINNSIIGGKGSYSFALDS